MKMSAMSRVWDLVFFFFFFVQLGVGKCTVFCRKQVERNNKNGGASWVAAFMLLLLPCRFY
jgi:hypothetical protein